jgi:hypothetical protein
MPELKFPTEIISLPSKGAYYPEGHPLASGQVELRYMTARDEDILSSTNLFRKGLVLDKLLESLLVDKTINPDDFLAGDKNAVLLTARILGYGKDYSVKINCPACDNEAEETIDLSKMEEKVVVKGDQAGKNEFSFLLPFSKQMITFKLLTSKETKALSAELESFQKKTGSEIPSTVTTRMMRSIVSINGESMLKMSHLREFVENMPARDALAFREYAKTVNPELDTSFDYKCGACGFEKRMEVPIDSGFFWPKS